MIQRKSPLASHVRTQCYGDQPNLIARLLTDGFIRLDFCVVNPDHLIQIRTVSDLGFMLDPVPEPDV
jgi:hypothetical protein